MPVVCSPTTWIKHYNCQLCQQGELQDELSVSPLAPSHCLHEIMESPVQLLSSHTLASFFVVSGHPEQVLQGSFASAKVVALSVRLNSHQSFQVLNKPLPPLLVISAGVEGLETPEETSALAEHCLHCESHGCHSRSQKLVVDCKL